jgi:hypothetical protein
MQFLKQIIMFFVQSMPAVLISLVIISPFSAQISQQAEKSGPMK